MQRRYFLGVGAMGYSRLTYAALQLALVPLFAITWGLPTYGQWLMIAAVPLFLAAGDLGFGTAASNRIIAEVARGETEEALTTFQSAWKMVLVLTTALALVVLCVCLVLPEQMLAVDGGMAGSEARKVLIVMCAYALIAVQEQLFAGVNRAQGRQPLAIVLTGTTVFIEGALAGLVAYLGGDPFAAALVYLCVRSVGVVVQALAARRLAPWLRFRATRASRQRVRELVRPALAAMTLPLASAGYVQGTAIVIGLAAGPAVVPLFTSLRTASRMALQLMNMLIYPIMPDYTAAHAQGREAAMARIGAAMFGLSLVAGIAAGLIVIFFGNWLLDVWTGGMIRPPQLMITLLGVALALSVAWNPLALLLLAINRHGTYAYSLLLLAAVTLGLTYALVRAMGVSGAALAQIPLELAMLAICYLSLRRNRGIRSLSVVALGKAVSEWRAAAHKRILG